MKPRNPPDGEGVTVYVGLGSNLSDPAAQLRRAFAELGTLTHTRVQARSRLYESKPLGPQEQPDFLNAVAVLETRLSPQALLGELRRMEERHGRRRHAGTRWGPRTLDLDILIYGDLSLRTPELTLPHPELHRRSFVLYPLAEVAPGLVIPGHGPVQALRERCRAPAIKLYGETADD